MKILSFLISALVCASLLGQAVVQAPAPTNFSGVSSFQTSDALLSEYGGASGDGKIPTPTENIGENFIETLRGLQETLERIENALHVLEMSTDWILLETLTETLVQRLTVFENIAYTMLLAAKESGDAKSDMVLQSSIQQFENWLENSTLATKEIIDDLNTLLETKSAGGAPMLCKRVKFIREKIMSLGGSIVRIGDIWFERWDGSTWVRTYWAYPGDQVRVRVRFVNSYRFLWTRVTAWWYFWGAYEWVFGAQEGIHYGTYKKDYAPPSSEWYESFPTRVESIAAPKQPASGLYEFHIPGWVEAYFWIWKIYEYPSPDGTIDGVPHTRIFLNVLNRDSTLKFKDYVYPSSGVAGTTFTYKVTYKDEDGHAPSYVRVYIDGSPRNMTFVSGDYKTGATFRYQWTTTSADVSTHNYYFTASDPFQPQLARLPPTGTYSGPTVTEPPRPFDFRLEKSSDIVVPQGGSSSTTIRVIRTSGPTQTVSLSGAWIDTAPTGITPGLNPTYSSPDYSSTLTVTATSNASIGTFTYRITGSGGGLIRTVDVKVEVTDATPPGHWRNFSPTTWVTTQTPTASVEVRNGESGLNVGLAQYRYSNDDGVTWSSWVQASCTGTNGTTAFQTITASSVPFDKDSLMPTQNRIQFRISDMAGNVGTSPQYYVLIDATPPTIEHEPLAEWQGYGPYVITAIITDEPSGVDVASLLVCYSTDGGASWHELPMETTPIINEYSASIPNQPHETAVWHYIRASDVAGNENTCPINAPASYHSLTVDKLPPTISVLSPPEFTNNPQPEISARVADAHSGMDATRIQLWLNGGLVDHAYDPVTGLVSHTPPEPLAEGTYSVTLIVADRVCNENQAEWQFVVDLTPPEQFDLVSPPDNSWTNDDTPTLSWQATTDALSGLEGYDLYIDGAFNRSVDNDTTSTTPVAPLAEGAHTWYIVARDRAGNVRQSASTWTINVDITPPVAANEQPPNNSTVRPGRRTVSVEVTDALSGVDPGSVAMSIDGVPVTPMFEPIPQGYRVSYTTTFRPNTAPVITVTASDLAGNALSFSWLFNVVPGGQQAAPAATAIAEAEQAIAQAELIIGSPQAAETLLANARDHLLRAKEAYEEGRYGEAYGLATSAKRLAEDAIKIAQKAASGSAGGRAKGRA